MDLMYSPRHKFAKPPTSPSTRTSSPSSVSLLKMAFLTYQPVLPARHTAPLQILRPVQPGPSLIQMSQKRPFFRNPFEKIPQPVHEFRTVNPHPTAAIEEDLTLYDISLDSRTAVDVAKTHIQLTLDAPSSLRKSHVRPGQFVQVSRPDSNLLCYLTIASPPGAPAIQLLVATAADPLKLCSLKPGKKLRVSPVLGTGLDCTLAAQTSHLLIFADSPQGFAAARSLVEWSHFRAITGEGANRTTHISMYYSVPNVSSIAYARSYSSWSVYGVNVIPLVATSVMESFTEPNAFGVSHNNLTKDHAIAFVATNETFEALYCALALRGLPRRSVQKLTQNDVELQVDSYDMCSEPILSDEDDEQWRSDLEHEIWQSWVRVRESMRAEFEKKWASQNKFNRDAQRQAAEKKQAWASWCAKNKDKWQDVEWDDQKWGSYWNSWRNSRQTWQSENWGWTGSGSSGPQSDSTGRARWNQQDSQEYWDWVGRGNYSQRTSSSSSNGSHQTSGNSYTQGSWGSKTGYQKGGYKYHYDAGQERKSNGQRRSYESQSRSSSSSGAGAGWSGWNRNSQSRQTSSSSGGRRNWSGAGKGEFGNLDLYAVLGIDSGASRSDIKKAYRKKAMQHHPDHNRDKSEEAHVIMKQIVVAWSVLKDENQRRKYDAGFGDLF